MTRDELVAIVRRAATADVAEAVERSDRPAARLVFTDAEQVEVGGSKFGGYPDLPDEVPWPSVPADVAITRRLLDRLEAVGPGSHYTAGQWEADLSILRDKVRLGGTPLTFLAQIDLAAVPPLDIALPRSGLLLFFYDANRQPWGHELMEGRQWRVVHVPTPAARAEGADDCVGHRAPYPGCGVLASSHATVAGYEPGSPTVRQSLFDDAVAAIWDADTGSDHWIGGHAFEIQAGELDWTCQRASHGVGPDDDPDDRHWQDAALAGGVTDWVLLLQLGSDDRLGWQWGDWGTLYFCIRRQDLDRGDFSRVWCVLQTG